MKQRIITGTILVLILTPIIIFPLFLEVFQVLMTIFTVVASYEMLRMYETEKKFRLATKIGIILLSVGTFASVGGVWGNYTHNPLDANGLLSITIPLITVILLSFLVLFKDFNGDDVGKALVIINYVGLGAASIVILRFLGVRFIVYLLLITTATDVFAYFFGIRFGKRKLAPHISPKKSWEGAIWGSIMATIIASTFALGYGTFFSPETAFGAFFNPGGEKTLLQNFSTLGETKAIWIQGFILVPITLVATIVAQIGDLVASRLKRTYDIKDFGTILPGHGGLMDRFDSVLFVAMFLAAVFILIYRLFPAYIIAA